MRILTALQGEYGKRIAENIQARSPGDWTVETLKLPPRLPVLIDEPEEFLPPDITEADLLLALIESDGAAQLVPALAESCGAKAAIVPVDDPSWLPLGLQTQVESEMSRDGVTAVFPRTFCTLTENSAGFRGRAVPYNNELISEFGRHFGKPRLRIELDDKGEKIKSVTVERGAPCGSTFHAAEKLAGIAADEAVPRAGLTVHQFPCLASMQQEEIDAGMLEYLMAISGYVMNEEVERALKSSLPDA